MARSAQTRRKIHPALVFAALILAAAIVRVVFLIQLERSEFRDVLSLDSRFYEELARSVLAGNALPAGALTFNPLYPLFLAVVFKLFGEGLVAPRIIQLILGLCTVALMYGAGARITEGPRVGRPSSRAVAVIAAAMTILYAQFVLYEGMLLSTAIEVFLLAACFALALSLDEDVRGERPLKVGPWKVSPWASGLVLGALCGAGALGRPNLFLLLVAALPIWLFLRNRRKRRGLSAAALFLAGAALFLAPPILYNASSTGRFVPVTAHGGINFYIGNLPGSAGVYHPPSDMRTDMRGLIDDAKAKAEAATGRSMTQPEVSDFFLQKALDNIKGDPAGWLRLLAKKLLLFFNGTEVPDVPNVFFYEQACGVMKLLVLPFALIAPLGLCGLVALFRSGRNRSIVSIFLGCALVSVLPFFVNVRYRLPAVPVLILLASVLVASAAREISRKRFKWAALMAVAAVSLFFLVSHRTFVKVNHSAAYSFLGNYYMEHKEEAKGEAAFAEAYRLDPNHIEAMINYARVLRRQGKTSESAALYARAYALMPAFPRLAIEYGSVLELLGRRDDGIKLYEEALATGRPSEQVLACRLLAQAALAEGKRDEAIRLVKRALEIAPNDENLTGMLGWLESSR
jgi:Flp pilus assembly protein TadD